MKRRLVETFRKVREFLHYSLDSYRHSFFRQDAIAKTAVAMKYSLEPVASDFF